MNRSTHEGPDREAASARRPGLVLRRGLRGLCPRCGQGRIFRRWLEIFDRCSECDLLYQRDYGDTWMFMIITDRVPLLVGIVLLYFGFRSTTWFISTGFFCALALPVIATLRNRQGLALALDYLSRIYFPDPSDEIHGAEDYVTVRPH